MLNLPAEIKAEASSQIARKPLLMLDIWADRGHEGVLDSATDWQGASDPYVGSDTSVDFTSLSGSALLAAGSTVTPAYVAPASIAAVLTARIPAGGVQSYSNKYSVPFTSSATQTLGSVVVQVRSNVGYASMGSITWNSSIASLTIRAWVQDSAGNIVGSVRGVYVSFNNTTQTITISRLNAYITAFKGYTLNFETYNSGGAIAVPGAWIQTTTNFYGCAVGTTKPQWRVGIFNTGGQEGFQASGSFKRVIDVGGVPSADGAIEITDTVPGINGADPTSLAITAEYSDTGTTGPWVTFGAVSDGTVIPPHQFWRFSVAMSSNSLADRTPTLDRLVVSYRAASVTFSTRGDIQNAIKYATNALSTINAATSQLSSKAQGAMTGEMRAVIADVPEWREIMGRSRLALKGVDCRLRAGYVDLVKTTETGTLTYPLPWSGPWTPAKSVELFNTPITFELYRGSLHDIKYSRGKFTPVLRDYIDLADVSVPKATSGPWASIVYTSQHLADIALDLLANQVNLRSSYIDAGSLAAVKAKYPLRTCTRTITKPVKVSEALGEIAFLLESQWLVRGGKLALIPDLTLADPVVENITPDDIQINTLSWSYGWDLLKNAIATFTGYTGDGTTANEQFTSGEGLVDAVSVNEIGQTFMEVAHDKWGIPTAEITAMNAAFVNKMKQGRQGVSFTASFRLIHLEPGDRVRITSSQIPTGAFDATVVRKDINWQKQTLHLTALEVF